METPNPFSLVTFVLLLFAALVGTAAGILTHMSGVNLPQTLLASGAAAGAGLLWAMAVLRMSR